MFYSYSAEAVPSQQAQSKEDAKKLWTITEKIIQEAKEKG
jgi:hypothetical protein